MIKEKTGISVQTLSRWLKKAGVEIDPKRGLSTPRGPLSEEHRAAVSEAKVGVPIAKRAGWRNEVRTCPRCGTEFTPTAPKQQSCSDECRLANLADRNRASIKIRHCPCGTQLPPFTETHSAYCSPECREMYANKGGRKRQDEKWVVKVCETCGKEFQFRSTSRNLGRFCSNVCAHRRPIERHPTPDGAILDSWWEHLVYSALKVAKISVERVDRSVHGVEFDGRFYAPDLFLPEQNIYIEVKGIVTPEQEAKWAAFRSSGRDLMVIGPDQIGWVSPEAMGLVVKARTCFESPEYQRAKAATMAVESNDDDLHGTFTSQMEAIQETYRIAMAFKHLRPVV